MREIKCPRAWDDVLGEMLYSKAEQFDDSLMFRFDKHFETQKPVYMWPTGLKDRNGKEIYEGDALSVQGGNEHQGYREFSETGYVEFASGSFMLAYHSHGNKVYADFGHFNQEDTEIIGNIYEHPHLLEDKADE